MRSKDAVASLSNFPFRIEISIPVRAHFPFCSEYSLSKYSCVNWNSILLFLALWRICPKYVPLINPTVDLLRYSQPQLFLLTKTLAGHSTVLPHSHRQSQSCSPPLFSHASTTVILLKVSLGLMKYFCLICRSFNFVASECLVKLLLGF